MVGIATKTAVTYRKSIPYSENPVEIKIITAMLVLLVC